MVPIDADCGRSWGLLENRTAGRINNAMVSICSTGRAAFDKACDSIRCQEYESMEHHFLVDALVRHFHFNSCMNSTIMNSLTHSLP